MTTPAKIVDQNLPTVAIVGRVNVGKSTLFNCITNTRHALVSKIAGTTRTRNVAHATWRGRDFILVDTGGLTFTDDIPLEKEIIEQTELGINQADLIIFVTDIKEGVLPQEKELAKLIQKKKKPVLLVCNKADKPSSADDVHSPEWRKLALGAPVAISAQIGTGVGDLLDTVYSYLNKLTHRPKVAKSFEPLKVTLVGKPNVGKSSLFNKLIGEDRVIVSNMPHTTREPHDTLVQIDDKFILFVDTAGIRRKTKVSGELEQIGIGKSIESIKRADIVLLLLDATEPITDQDQQLAGLLREQTKSVIIVVNKWDRADDNDDEFRNTVKETIYAKFPHLNYAPIVFVSAKSGYRIHQIFPMIERAALEQRIFIEEEELNKFMAALVKKHLPSRGKGVNHPKITGLHQLPANFPVFEMFIKSKTSIHYSYVHYVINRLREKYSFYAAPIIIKLTKMRR